MKISIRRRFKKFRQSNTALLTVAFLIINGFWIWIARDVLFGDMYSLVRFEPANFMNSTPNYNIGPVKFYLNNIRLCADIPPGSKVAITVVHTARNHSEIRSLIRKTYGSVGKYKDWYLPVIFMVGVSQSLSPEEDSKIKNESEFHGDVIVGDFIDTYRNLTFKHLVSLQWALEFCPNAEFYIKTDDDNLIEVFLLTELLDTIAETDYNFYCKRIVGWRPIRGSKHKYFTSLEEYPYHIYPDYCGGLYVTRIQTVGDIYAVSDHVRSYWIEDVYISGMLRECINFKRRNTSLERIEIIPDKVESHYELNPKVILRGIQQQKYIEIATEMLANRTCLFWNAVLDSYGYQGKYSSC